VIPLLLALFVSSPQSADGSASIRLRAEHRRCVETERTAALLEGWLRADERTRLDFRLGEHRRGKPDAWVEVKSVTLAEGSLALFPDSVTERGRRHLETLIRLREAGDRAALLFLVQRSDCDRVAPADAIDPAYGEALRRAAAHGVEIFALGARVTARAITVERRLQVVV